MPVIQKQWVKKTLGACLAFSFSTLTLYTIAPTSTAYAHAEHGSEGGIPTVSPKSKLPKGISLQVVKSNAYQFALSTDGKQRVEILGEDKRPFLRFEENKLYADLNATGWHRSRQPGGGPLPDRLKNNAKLPANWVLLDKQPGYGWYDPRLVREDLAHFNLQMVYNGKPLRVKIEKIEPEPMRGYWRPMLSTDTPPEGLNAMVPGLSGNTFMLSRFATAADEFEVLDDEGNAFLELRKDGTWLNSQHPWANKLELFHEPGTASAPWVKVSDSGTVTYADPRLNSKPASPQKVGSWGVPVRVKGTSNQTLLKGELRWQTIVQAQ